MKNSESNGIWAEFGFQNDSITFTEYSLYAWHCSKYFTYIISFKPHHTSRE